jgi:hypothetical protein
MNSDTLEMIKIALREFQREQKAKAVAKREKKKGKNVPGKNLSKNSQCDGNDEEPPGPSKRGQRNNFRTAAKKARQTIAQQTPLIDSQLPKGDRPFELVEEDEEDSDDGDESDTFEEDNEENEKNESLDDDFQSAKSFHNLLDSDPPGPKPPPKAEPEHCWVESFDLELNSKRIDAFKIPSNYQNLISLPNLIEFIL